VSEGNSEQVSRATDRASESERHSDRQPEATEPAASSPTPPSALLVKAGTRERLIRLYAKYAPEKVADVDRLLQKIVGNEEAAFAQLVHKYGAEPLSVLPEALKYVQVLESLLVHLSKRGVVLDAHK